MYWCTWYSLKQSSIRTSGIFGRDKAKIIKNNYLCFICELKLLVCLIEELLAGGDLVLETRDQLNLGVQLLAQPRFVENPSTSSSISGTQHFKTESSLSEEDNFLQKQQEKTNLVAASRPAPACSIWVLAAASSAETAAHLSCSAATRSEHRFSTCRISFSF